jgi:CRP-like cAMP-binding protein
MSSTGCTVCELKSKAVKNLQQSELDILGKNCLQAVFEPGETIFKQGALSSNIIYLQKGLVKITIKGPQRIQIMRVKKAPSYLGLPTTMGDKVNHYSAIAVERSTACFIDIKTFKELLWANPAFSYEIMLELCKNELEQYQRCVKLVQNQTFGRLAANLLMFSEEIYESADYDLPLNRNDLADLMCASRETVSRLLSDLIEEKIIEVKGKHVGILNYERLRTISEKG